MARIAVIDMGSNTIRLALYEIKSSKIQKYKKLIDIKSTAGLSNYIEDGCLTNDGINKAAAVLKDHIERSLNLGCDKILIFATAVIRNCRNSEIAKRAIENKVNHKITILSGIEEARLGLKGVLSATDIENGILVDLGGGSCEITVFHNRDTILKTTSIPIGCISSYKNNVEKLFPSQSEAKEIKCNFKEALDAHINLDEYDSLDLYAIGGSIRAIAKLHAIITESGKPMRFVECNQLDAILDLYIEYENKFSHMAVKATPERLHSIIPGIIIFKEIMNATNKDRIDILKRGVREGYLLENLK